MPDVRHRARHEEPTTIIAITGHTRYAATDLVRHALRDRLAGHQGADQIFADVVLEHGGTIEVAVPSRDYFLHTVGDPDAAQLRHGSQRRRRSAHSVPTENAPPVVTGGRFRVSTTSELRSDDVAAG